MIILLLILSVLIGVLLGKFFGHRGRLAKNILIVSAGFLITICVTAVFPEVYHSHIPNIGIWVVVGILLQMFLENLTKGFEHGHFHHPTEKGILPYTLMIGLFIHAFIEGVPLSNESDYFSPYLQGILIHNIPISFILGAFLFQNKKLSAYSWLIVVLFALASPLGLLLGKYIDPNLTPYFLAVVGGIFLHISSVIIFESNKNHNIDWEKMMYVLLGVSVALLTQIGHQHSH